MSPLKCHMNTTFLQLINTQNAILQSGVCTSRWGCTSFISWDSVSLLLQKQ